MKVYLDAGHGGTDSGAVGIGGRLEKDDTNALTLLVADLLTNSGIQVFLIDILPHLKEGGFTVLRHVSS